METPPPPPPPPVAPAPEPIATPELRPAPETPVETVLAAPIVVETPTTPPQPEELPPSTPEELRERHEKLLALRQQAQEAEAHARRLADDLQREALKKLDEAKKYASIVTEVNEQISDLDSDLLALAEIAEQEALLAARRAEILAKRK